MPVCNHYVAKSPNYRHKSYKVFVVVFFLIGIYQLPSRRLTDVSLLQSKCIGREDSGDDFSDIDETVTLDGISLSPMITTVCDQLLWDWKNNKSKHIILYTTKPANSLESFSRKPPVPE